MLPPVRWPDGKAFAFTIFDDPDSQTVPDGRTVYSFLHDLGFKTTKGVWPIWGTSPRSDPGGSCDDDDYREWCLELAAQGFEIGYHNATQYTSDRDQTTRGLTRYAEIFGHPPVTMSNHYNCDEDIYWGENRVGGVQRLIYNAATRGRARNKYFGHVPGHPLFWGDLCKAQIKYVRNFVFARINTLEACPHMPYHDPLRPFVNYWYASSEASNAEKMVRLLAQPNQDQLVAEGGACIVYTHFAHGYVRNGVLDPDFRRLMTRLSKLNGWFVPVSTLLDHLLAVRGATSTSEAAISDAGRTELERRWLWDKLRSGTA